MRRRHFLLDRRQGYMLSLCAVSADAFLHPSTEVRLNRIILALERHFSPSLGIDISHHTPSVPISQIKAIPARTTLHRGCSQARTILHLATRSRTFRKYFPTGT